MHSNLRASRRRMLIVGIGITLTAAAITVGILWWWLVDAPLQGAGGTSITVPTSPGRPVAFSVVDLRARPGLELQSAEPVDPPPGLRVEVRIQRMGPRGFAGTVAELRRRGSPLVPVSGQRLDAGQRVALVHVLSARRPGRYALTRTRVRYRAGVRRGEITVAAPAAIEVSPPGR